MLMEECAELIQAANKYLRYKDNKFIIQEIADVEIMIEQMKSQLGIEEEIENVKAIQLKKLMRYIQEQEVDMNGKER